MFSLLKNLRIPQIFLPAVMFGAIGSLGCNTEPPIPETELVYGVVTLDDEPLPNATVMFYPSGSTSGIECSGTTDATGRFEIKHPRGAAGAPAGSYSVIVSRYVDGSGKAIDPKSDIPPADLGAVESLPPKYSSPDATVLKATVPPPEGEIKIELKSK